MARVSKFVNLDPNILIEYIYDNNNLIGESYKILVNIQDDTQSFISGDNSGTNNTQINQLFELDPTQDKYGLVDTNNYNFLQIKDFSGGLPISHDRIKIHLPTTYTFDEFIGFHLKIYSFDYQNNKTYDISNFYFDITNSDQFNLINFSSPPLLYREILWGKNIEIDIPSIHSLSNQRENGNAKIDTINSNLTHAFGISQTSPVFIEFQFIQKKLVINNVVTYKLDPKRLTTLPQTPEFENLSVVIKESDQGDFFEIFGTFNNTSAEFKKFIEDSFILGKRYFVQYVITLYEENIMSNPIIFTVIDNFNNPVEYRPIIKFSTTTAVIDVEMRLIDQVDNSQIMRRASFGMLQDQVSKYSLNLTKINISNASKPKIYNLKSSIDISSMNIGGGSGIGGQSGGIQFEKIEVPVPVLIDRSNVVAKSENAVINSTTFYGIGKLQVIIYPFDNILNIVIAQKITSEDIEYMNLIGHSNIEIIFKNSLAEVKSPLFTDGGNVDLEIGFTVFRIRESDINDIRRIFGSGINVFYITSLNEDGYKTVIYSGTFTMYDSLNNINNLNSAVKEEIQKSATPTIIEDNEAKQREFAIVTRRKILSQSPIKRPKSPGKQ